MTNGTYLTRDQILAAQELPAEDVPVPEWGGTLRLRGMTIGERDTWRTEYNAGNTAVGKFLAVVIVDHEGKAVFTEADFAAMPAKQRPVIERLVAVGLRLSGLENGAVAVAEKNSEPGVSASAPSN